MTTVDVSRFDVGAVSPSADVENILASSPWLERSAIELMVKIPTLRSLLGKGSYGSVYLMEASPFESYALKMELGDVTRFPVWEGLLGAFLFIPQKDLVWREQNRVPLSKNVDPLKSQDVFLHIADYYGVVAVDHSQLEDFARMVAREAAERAKRDRPGEVVSTKGLENAYVLTWTQVFERAEETLETLRRREHKKLWEMTPFATDHPLVFSVQEFFEEGNVTDYLDVKGRGGKIAFANKVYLLRVAFFQITETLKVLNRELEVVHGDPHGRNVLVRAIPKKEYRFWYRTEKPGRSRTLKRVPPSHLGTRGALFALGDLGFGELDRYPLKGSRHSVASPRHDLHLLIMDLLRVACEAYFDLSSPSQDDVEVLKEFADDADPFFIGAKDVTAAEMGAFQFEREMKKKLLDARPKPSSYSTKKKRLTPKEAKDFADDYLDFREDRHVRYFDLDMGGVGSSLYEAQEIMADKITDVVKTPNVRYRGSNKTEETFWKKMPSIVEPVEF